MSQKLVDPRYPISSHSLTHSFATSAKYIRLKALISSRKSAESSEQMWLDFLTLTSVDLGRPESEVTSSTRRPCFFDFR